MLKALKNHTNKKVVTIVSGPLILVLWASLSYFLGGRYISTDNAYIKSSKTSISAEVSGKISRVYVKNNTSVHKGDIVFLVDKSPFEIAIKRAAANVDNILAEIEGLRSEYFQKMTSLKHIEEFVRHHEKECRRYQALANKMAASQEKSEQMRHNLEVAKKELDAAKHDINAIKIKLGGDPGTKPEEHPRIKHAMAELERAKLDLVRTEIRTPGDGVVSNFSLEPGQYVAVGSPLFSLVSDTERWVEANFKETDVRFMRIGQDADVLVDVYPGVRLEAVVESISPATGSEFAILPAQNSSGNWVKVVQRIMVKLRLKKNYDQVENQEQIKESQLASGMSANVTIDTGLSRISRFFGWHEAH